MSELTLDEAIKHCEEVATEKEDNARWELTSTWQDECKRCAAEHRQLAEWLTELKELRELKTEYKRLLKAAVDDMYNSVNDVHCKYCSKWHTDQCQGTSHLDCYIENKFKWRYADEAIKLIGGNENG